MPRTPSSVVPALSLLLPALLALGCAAARGVPAGGEDRRAWDEPPIERCVSVRDGATGDELSFDELLDRLAAADAVFLGETHIDETTHRVEQAVYAGLLARRGGRVVLALEMFERDVQPKLDAYLAGEIEEQAFLAAARPWANYRTAYRPLIERARAGGRPVLASNFPRPLLMQVAQGGAEALAVAPPGQVPAEIIPNSSEYHRRTDNAVRGHLASMRAPAEGDDARLYSTQTLWDNSMGETCARALAAHPGHSVLHVNGGFHSAYFDGTVRQLRLRAPDARVLTVDIGTRGSPRSAELRGAQAADFTVFAESRASDLDDGAFAVSVARELAWRLHLPESARDGSPVPLLIWLGDDGLTAEDGLALWTERLGAECAIAAIEPPYRAIQQDLSNGGAWYWPDTFSEDLGALVGGLEGVLGYALRHFPLDPERVCIAGEGTGATVAAAAALLTDRMPVRSVALAPKKYARVRDFPLPLPEDFGDDPPPARALRVLAGGEDAAFWDAEIEAYSGVGLDASRTAPESDPWTRELEQENALRAALELPCREAPGGAQRHVLLEDDAPRARHWARLHALFREAAGGGAVAVLDAPPEPGSSEELPLSMPAAEVGASLPRCPGPFGGTTVIVLPEGAPPEEIESWLALERDDPLAAESRFHRLRVAGAGTGRELPALLEELAGAGRTNVLVAPATFHASGETMRALARSARQLEDRMTLNWLPGLGGGVR